MTTYKVVLRKAVDGEEVMRGETLHSTVQKAENAALRSISHYIEQGYENLGEGYLQRGQEVIKLNVEIG